MSKPRPQSLQGAPAHTKNFPHAETGMGTPMPWIDRHLRSTIDRKSYPRGDRSSSEGSESDKSKPCWWIFFAMLLTLVVVGVSVAVVYLVIDNTDDDDDSKDGPSDAYIVKYDGSFSYLKENFTSDLNDPSSSRFKEFAQKTCQKVDNAFKDSTDGYIDCQTNRFGDGSVIADYTFKYLYKITIQKKDGMTAEEQEKALADALADKRGEVEPSLRTIFINAINADQDLGNANINTNPSPGDITKVDPTKDPCNPNSCSRGECVKIFTDGFNTGFTCRCPDTYTGALCDEVEPCVKRLEITEPFTITSPGYPTPGYDNNLKCTWVLTTSKENAIIDIMIKRLRLEQNCKFDKVQFFKGAVEDISKTPEAEKCGIVDNENIRIDSSRATVKLITDDQYNNDGFELMVKQVEDVDACAGENPCQNGGTCQDGRYDYTCSCPNNTVGKNCEIAGCGGDLVATAAVTDLFSPGYPNDRLTDNLDCSWKISSAPGTRIELTLTEFYLTYYGSPLCSYESMKVYSDNNTLLGTYCGRINNEVILSLDNTMTLNLQTIAAFFPQRRFFKTSYKQVSDGDDCDPSVNPCKNGATCTDGEFSAICGCVGGWNGSTCEMRNECVEDQPCANGGECEDLPDSYYCKCAKGFTGKQCSDVDPCDDNPCNANEVCMWDSNKANNYRCESRGCGQPPITPSITSPNARVIGGSHVKPAHSFPWMVAILYNRRGKFNTRHYCSGILIDSTHFLTTAHCVPTGEIALFGIHDLDTDECTAPCEMRTVTSHTDPGYNPDTWNNDIALATFHPPVQFSDQIYPVCLPAQGADPAAGTFCTLVGWGSMEKPPEEGYDPILQMVQVPIVDRPLCKELMDRPDSPIAITDEMICAGKMEGGIDACYGDSGGPLACKEGDHWVLQGVVAWGHECAQARSPGVYTRTSSYTNWIEGLLRNATQTAS